METNPASVESPPTRSVLEAWRGEPATTRPEENVEEAVAIKPPEAFREKIVVEAAFCTERAEPVCPVSVFKTRLVAAVEVAAIVATEVTSAEVVPTERLSERVVRWTRVPASVKPVFVSASVPQKMFPEESVSSAWEQERMVAIWAPPVCIWRPPRKVDEAEPETRRVLDAWSRPETPRAPETVDDAWEMRPALKVPSD